MNIKSAIHKVTSSKPYSFAKELITLGGNSKFAPSALTFFIMVSLVPVLTLIVLVLSVLGYSVNDLLSYIQQNLDLSDSSMSILNHYFLDIPNSNKIVFGFSLFLLIYISSKGITFFTYAYQKINNIPPKYTNFFFQRLYGIFLAIISEIFLAFLIVFLAFFANIVQIKNNVLKQLFFSILILVLMCVFLTFLYSISSNKKVKLSDIITGSFFSSFSITIGMSLYIFYLTNISNASNYYGSLTNFILLLLVIYYSSYVVLLGVQINHMLFKRKRILQMEDS